MIDRLHDKAALLLKTLNEVQANAERLLAMHRYPQALNEIHEAMILEREIVWVNNLIEVQSENARATRSNGSHTYETMYTRAQ